MPASELQRLVHRVVGGTCMLSLSATAWAPAWAAAHFGSTSIESLNEQAARGGSALLAQRRQNLGGGYARPAGGAMTRPAGRPEGRPITRPGARPGFGGGGGAIARPAPGFDRGNRRPTGGWVENVPAMRPRPRPYPGQMTRPALPPGSIRPGPDRPNRPAWNPGWNRPGWNQPNWVINRPVNINTINVRPRWWGPAWVGARPWRYGWYSGVPSSWGWWGGSSLAWGITSLASAAIIASAINNAVRDNTPTVDVTNSPYQLVFGSVEPVGDHDVNFSFLFEGSAFQASADCKSGLLNNRTPENAEEAQLINAACQVAYASF